VSRNWLKWLFSFEGRVGRAEYFVAGVLLAGLKIALDWWMTGHFVGRSYLWGYDLPVILWSDARPRGSYVLFGMLAITIPFFWMGIALTVRRLRDAGRHLAWSCLYFAPILKYAMFVWLVMEPSKDSADDPAVEKGPRDGRVMGVVVASLIGLLLVVFGTKILAMYSWGLFLGVPFLMGFVSSWLFNRKTIQTANQTVWMSLAPIGILGVALLMFGLEGVICLVMALPLAAPFCIAGGLMARNILMGDRPRTAPRTFTACIALLPAMMVGERAAKMEPPVNAVTTSIVIDAPVDVVWRNVIAFPPLAPPEETIFKAGVAYPIAGQIVGSGVGAVRYCRFSTGDFVEPITTWDENRLLAFNVAAQPHALRELSPWEIVPEHIEKNYMRSQHGQFRLTALDEHRTLLEGTTWYQNYLWPQQYWREWSDGIVHTIHLRVLRHVKAQAEMVVRRER
jgi:uncharacterized membrane protein YhaH (DUF805 family)